MSQAAAHQRALVSRRGLLKAGVAVGGALSFGPAFWQRAYAQGGLVAGETPYGPLQPADGNGMMLPPGFSSRLIAASGTPVGLTAFVWHQWPDGGHCFPTDSGGWVYCSNSENPLPADFDLPGQNIGGASSIEFDADGNIVDAFAVLTGSRSNCAGGPTPWGTWLSCEEVNVAPGNAGHVWEVDPLVPEANQTPKRHDAMGLFKHEMAAIDPTRHVAYETEDEEDGLFYRFTPSAWPDLSAGALEAAVVAPDGAVSWEAVPDPLASSVDTRAQVPNATPFNGGEGCWFDSDRVYLTTKGDDRVWEFDVVSQKIRVLYDSSLHTDPVLTGVDNLIVSTFTGDILVAEDGGNMEVVMITPEGVIAPLVRATGPEHGAAQVDPFPTVSEITGLAFSPDGTRLYFSSQRGAQLGLTYEVAGPFAREVTPQPQPTPSTPPIVNPTSPPDDEGDIQLPVTGVSVAAGVAALGVAAAVRARRRAADEPER